MFNVSIVWSLFATWCSKGRVDKVDGTVKWLVRNNIIRRLDHNNDAESILNSLVKCNTKTKCCISSNNSNSIVEKDLQIIFSNVSALNRIFTTHQTKNVNG